MTADSQRHHKFLVLIFILAGLSKIFLFSLSYTADSSTIFSPDSASYVQSALALLKTGRFSVSPEHPDAPQLIRTPGYPAFIASLFRFSEQNYPLLIVSLASVGLLPLDIPSFTENSERNALYVCLDIYNLSAEA